MRKKVWAVTIPISNSAGMGHQIRDFLDSSNTPGCSVMCWALSEIDVTGACKHAATPVGLERKRVPEFVEPWCFSTGWLTFDPHGASRKKSEIAANFLEGSASTNTCRE
jgi:hypothetical protein